MTATFLPPRKDTAEAVRELATIALTMAGRADLRLTVDGVPPVTFRSIDAREVPFRLGRSCKLVVLAAGVVVEYVLDDEDGAA